MNQGILKPGSASPGQPLLGTLTRVTQTPFTSGLIKPPATQQAHTSNSQRPVKSIIITLQFPFTSAQGVLVQGFLHRPAVPLLTQDTFTGHLITLAAGRDIGTVLRAKRTGGYDKVSGRQAWLAGTFPIVVAIVATWLQGLKSRENVQTSAELPPTNKPLLLRLVYHATPRSSQRRPYTNSVAMNSDPWSGMYTSGIRWWWWWWLRET